MVNIFFATTTLQLLNCIDEAKNYSASENILIFGKKHPNLDLKLIEEVKDFGTKYLFDYSMFDPFKRFLSLRRMMGSVKEIAQTENLKTVYFGNIYEMQQNYFFQHLSGKERIVLVDDGTLNLNFPDRIKNGYFIKGQKNLQYYKNLILYRYKGKDVNRPELFSIYKLDYPAELLRKNTYQNLFKDKKHNKDDNKVVLIGANWASYISSKQYIEILKKIWKMNQRKDIIYCPHPAENLNLLEESFNAWGFKTKKNSLGIEWYLINEADFIPSKIYSFSSSAMIVLDQFYKGKSDLFILPPLLKLGFNNLIVSYFKENRIGNFMDWNDIGIDHLEIVD
ncbi:glycosyltransferase family 52 [Marivirga harenae]|uniref:glycosyltransferase family 52 n=1 Tax=Marivirga harenae TaxID=2010992 RepID=UPI0026DEE448|nr:glycosyltransferase family 52 [Marivirga harenae]WKV11366.1 glycosyltransferase family 52 [Marivirga harenae]